MIKDKTKLKNELRKELLTELSEFKNLTGFIFSNEESKYIKSLIKKDLQKDG